MEKPLRETDSTWSTPGVALTYFSRRHEIVFSTSRGPRPGHCVPMISTGGVSVGVAGGLLSSFYYVFPEVGGNFGLIAFVVVALGGFGSVAGAFIAGIIVGIVEVVTGYLIAPSLKFMFVLLLYLGVVFIRPQGLMGKK